MSNASLSRSLYDPYVKAFRWSTDRLDKDGGIICFISNSGWLDGNSTDGFRKSIEKEFTSIYVFNLRGSIRGKSGISAKREGQNVFDIMTGVAITLLVKNPEVKTEKATIHYHDIGDFLNRKEKIAQLIELKSFASDKMKFNTIEPNVEGDWINFRNASFENFIPLTSEKNLNVKSNSFFVLQNPGLLSARESWVYNFSQKTLIENMTSMIAFYEHQRKSIDYTKINSDTNFDELYDTDSKKISWSRALKNDLRRNTIHSIAKDNLSIALLRPFYKQNIYYDKNFIESPSQFSKLLSSKRDNIFICLSGIGGNGFALTISNILSDYALVKTGNGGTQCFPLYYYEENNATQKGIFDENNSQDYIRRDAVSDFILEKAKKQYGKNVTKEDIFYYVYGFLHSPTYRETFANDLKKMLPRLPLVEDVNDFWAFSKAGRKLAELHLNYETVAPFAAAKVNGDDGNNYQVDKMKFIKKDQKDTIIYNNKITISNIPAKAYEYVVNGKSAIEWIMERYQVSTHKESGITNNPNDWATEVGNPRYILDLLLSIINVSVQTVDIVNSLPNVKYE